MYKCFFVSCLLAVLVLTASGQDADTAAIKPVIDSTAVTRAIEPTFIPKIKKERKYYPDTTHSPQKAVVRSLMIPGWGQVYNRRWWKVPLVYTGMGLLGSAIVFNQRNYSELLAINKYRQSDKEPKPGDKYYKTYQEYKEAKVSDAAVRNYIDLYRRNRDLSILSIFGVWGIQMIDAYIDAKFKRSYTMDNDLSFLIRPGIINPSPYSQDVSYASVPCVKVSMEF